MAVEADDPLYRDEEFPSSASPPELDYNLVIDSMVEVNMKAKSKAQAKTLCGVIKWIGTDERIGNERLAGLELEEGLDVDYKTACTDGIYLGRKYFDSPTRKAFFTKLRHCRPDSRFNTTPVSEIGSGWGSEGCKGMMSIEGYILPDIKCDEFLGREMGIQGHHNSCYMDSTLFAMFSYSNVFDIALHRKKRTSDILEYNDVQNVLKRKIVNPLRKTGYVHHGSVLQLRKYLEKIGNIGGFMTEEKDPEEFIVLLFDKVLKVEPFVTLRMAGSDHEEVSHLYQIFAEKDDRHALPSIQYLLEYSFLTSDLQLANMPSVMILQMPRFGQQKLYKRIQLQSEIDISHLMTDARYECFICGESADGYCKECSCVFLDTVYTYFCTKCHITFHHHPKRKGHKQESFKEYLEKSYSTESTCNTMELFSVVCIEKSHYVSFSKSDENTWLFFDSMADRVGGESGYNIPEVSTVAGVSELLSGDSNGIMNLEKKKDEKVLRLFEDASLCFYRCKHLSMYR